MLCGKYWREFKGFARQLLISGFAVNIKKNCRWIMGIVFGLVVLLFLALKTDWVYFSVCLVVIYYFCVMVAIYGSVRPRKSEAPLLFFLYMLSSAVFSGIFAAVYSGVGGEGGFVTPDLDSLKAFYYSVVVFTSLGFGDIVPNTDSMRFATAIEALLGGAHGFSFLTIVAGKLAFAGSEKATDSKAGSL